MNSYQNTPGVDVANSDAINCDFVVERLGDYVANELPTEVSDAMDLHLNDCVDCTAFLASYKHIIEVAAELNQPEQPIQVDVQNRLRDALNKRLGISLPLIA